MKYYYELLIIFLFFIFQITSLTAQDYLVYSRLETNSYTTKQFKVDQNGRVLFFNELTKDSVVANVEDISDIEFTNSNTCKIQIPKLKMYNVPCSVSYISKNKIYYKDLSNPEIEQKVSKKSVFGILYNNSFDSLAIYEHSYKSFKGVPVKTKQRIERTYGKDLRLLELHSFNNGKLLITIEDKLDSVAHNKTISTNVGDKLVLKEHETGIKQNKTEYVLTSDYTWLPIRAIYNYNDEDLELKVTQNGKSADVVYNKNDLFGMFFHNYSEDIDSLGNEIDTLDFIDPNPR